MRSLAVVSLSALALAGCAAKKAEVAAAPVAAAPAAAAYTPVIPKGSGIFAAASTLPFQAPDFTRIRDSDFQSAIEQGIAIQLAEIDVIARNPEPPSFDNTLVAMEQAGQMLTRVRSVLTALKMANTNPALDAVDKATAPQLAGLSDSTYFDARLFARIKALHDRQGELGLRLDQARLLKVSYDRFVKNGALLGDADKLRLKAINARISTLETEFGQKLTAATRDGALVIGDRRKLAGLSTGELAAAAKAAEDRGLKGKWVLTLYNTTQQPLLASLKDRATRKALFEAGRTRTTRGDANDTRALIAELAALRAQKAALLGFADFASFTMSDQMARNPATALGFMQQMVPALAIRQRQEAAELNALIKRSGGRFGVQPWDWDFYTERLRKEKYAFDETAVKPYFEITNVLENGVFFAASQLYGLSFRKRGDIPVYHPDVTVYTVYDADGSELALFYFDPWNRDNKQGGAWYSTFVGQSHLLGTRTVGFNVLNAAKPAPGQPALIGFDDVRTMFHEFGHALHGLLSNQTYPVLSGTQTSRDFAELPSQFNENWMTEPRVFANYARHYRTGAAMPAQLVAKVQRAARFNQGYALGEIVGAAMLDQRWHALTAGAGRQDVDAFEGQALASLGLESAAVPPRYRSSYFRHIWSGGYAANYYAYLWTEMLQHDAYQWFASNGGMTRANGDRFRALVLSRGNSQDLAEMYRGFAGRDPGIEPMLRARGLK
jgi:peptidyl-dipeptidase Dcp